MIVEDPLLPHPAVLIVDDDPDIAAGLLDLLEHDGYEVQSVSTGREAIARVSERSFAAVLLDLGLPDCDGSEVLAAILSVVPTLPVIVLTAYSTLERSVASLGHGAFAFLAKPYNREELRSVLRRAVGVRTPPLRGRTSDQARTAEEERFRSVVQQATDAIILANARGIILSCNPAAQRLFGRTESQLTGQPLTMLMPARYREAHQRGLERFASSGESRILGKTVEMHALRQDESEFPIELTLTTWTSQQGTFFCGIIRDITLRKRAEEALQISEERYRVLYDDNPSMYFTVDPEGLVQSVNRFGADQLGYAVSELIGQPVFTVVHEEDRASIRRHLASCLALDGHVLTWEFRKVRKDGTVMWVKERARVVRNHADRPLIMIVCEDISERKQAQDALHHREQGLHLLLDKVPGILWTTDRDLRFTSSLGTGLTLLRHRPNEVVGTTLYDYFNSRDDSFPAIAAHRRALSGESITYEQAWMGLTFHTHVEPLRNDTGQIIGTIGIAIERTPYQREPAPDQTREGRLEST
ncbi:MAG TPA: PAS domain S-box protein [Nitrospiraceae bacterium]|nr:PAS domain S-box protein [Nitrospiraceae bacterium]